MKKIVAAIDKFIVQKLIPEDISMKHRLCNLIYASTLIGSLGTLIVSSALLQSAQTLLSIVAAILVVGVSFYLSVFRRKHTLAAIIILLLVDEIIFPVMFYVNGGIHSGMPIWFVLGLMFPFLVLEGKICILTFGVAAATLGACIGLEVSGIITTIPLEGAVWASDVAQSMIIVAFIFGVFFQLQSFIYNKQNKMLMEKEKELITAMTGVEEANKAKSEFLASMSHEIRTPINAVMGFNEIILRDSQEKETIQNSQRIAAASKNLLSLVNNILDFSKIESGKMEIIYEDYKLSSVINDCYNMVYMRAYNKGLTVKVTNDPEIPDSLNGDRFHIVQIITNLLTNAVKYTNTGGIELKINYKKLDDNNINLIIAVIDTGIGIAEEDIGKLFTNFQRLEERKNRTIEGTGLGLAIAARLAEQMGGKIEVQSELEKGSTFTATIPQKVNEFAPIGKFTVKSEATGERTGQKYKAKFVAPDARILVVDDIRMNLVVVKGLLKSTRVKIDMALSGMEGIKFTDENKYDVILLDHMMPEMDGIETLKLLKEKNNINADTPVIALTANALKGVEKEYLDAGFNDYLSKPVNGADLESMILKYLPMEKVLDE